LKKPQRVLGVHIHVYGSDEEETITSVLQTYQKTIARFKEQGHVLAPMENGGTTQQ